MKHTFKRLISVVLLLGILCSFAVPATWADTAGSEGRVVQAYDIWLCDKSLAHNEGYNALLDYSTKTSAYKHTYPSNIKGQMDELYNATEGLTLNWTFVAAKDAANLIYRTDAGMLLRLRGGANNWAALKIRVPESGNFRMNFSTDTATKSNTGNITLWTFPASALEEAQGETDILKVESLMTSANSLGTQAATAGVATVTFDEKAYTAGEYIVVYQCSVNDVFLSELALVDPNGSSAPTTNTTLPNSTEGTGPAVGTVAEAYDLWLYSAEDKGYNSALFPKGNTRNVKVSDIKSGLDGFYNATSGTTLNWTYVATSDESNLYFRNDADMILRMKGAGQWVALKLRVPESGNFELTFSTDTARNTGNVTAYMFPAADLAGEETVAKIESLKTSANCLGTQAMKDLTTVTFGAKEYEAGEYILVYQSDAVNTFLTGLQLVVAQQSTAPTVPSDTTAPEETTVPDDAYAVYNFDVYNNGYRNLFKGTKHTLTDTCNCGCKKTIVEHLSGEYQNLNWMYVDSSVGAENIAYRSDGNWGVRLRGEGVWMAFKLNVPVSGTYGLQFTAAAVAPGKYEAYVLPAADYEAGSNRADFFVGSVTMDTSKLTDVFGNVTIAAPGEHYVVLQMGGSGSTTMYLSQLALVDPVEKEPETPTPTTPVQPEEPGVLSYTEGVFNLELYKDAARKPNFTKDGVLRNLSHYKNCYVCKKPLEQCIANEYAAGTLNWKLEYTNFAELIFRAQTNAGVQMYGATDEKGEAIYYTAEDGTQKMKETYGNFIALRTKVANPGTYTVTFHKSFAYGYVGDLYIVPAPAAAMSKAELEAAMTDANRVGPVEFTASMQKSKVGEYNFAAGEYIFIIKATSAKRMYLSSITLTTPVPDAPIPAQDKLVYDFDQAKDDPNLIKKGMTSKYNEDGSVRTRDVLENLYKEGKIFWKYENMSSTANPSACNFRDTCLRFKDEVNFRDREDAWYAFRIKNPGTATYDIRLTSSGASMVSADIYLVPVPSEMTLSVAKIKAAMTEENRLVKGAIIDKKETFYLGEYTFGTEQEYVLVVKLNKGTMLFLNKIEMTLDGKVADGTVKKEKVYNGVVYDFDMADALNGIVNKASLYASEHMETLNSMWRSGELNWKWETASEGLLDPENPNLPAKKYTRFYRATGMRFNAGVGAWSAFRIKSPGSGTYTLSLIHALTSDSGVSAVYILPGDTEDIAKAMDPSNRAGKVAMYNDGSAAVVDGEQTYLGYWDFEAGKEYILVFEAYTKSPYGKYCYNNISQLVAERGKVEYTEKIPEKVITPMVAADSPIKVADPTAGGAVVESGGHQYLIIPMEGGSTLTYDLTSNKVVEVFDSYFKRPEDVAVAPDGKVWIVGQSKFLVCYDPATGEVFQTENFTKVPALAAANGSISVLPGQDGKIYFGTYYDGQICTYDPVTEKYEVLLKVMEGQWDSMSVKIRGIQILGDYLYLLACNEVNDVAVKFNLTTRQVEKTVDLTEYKGTLPYIAGQEVLGNGDYLYMTTNTSNNNKAFALDPETMEVVFLDLPSMGVGHASEIIDGKQYVFCTGYGMYVYDVNTKEFAKVPGFNSSIGFKTARTQVTIDGKDYLMSFNKTADVHFYDIETYEQVAGPGLYKYGNGASELRGFANGAEGSNELFIGAFNNPVGFIYNTKTNEITTQYTTGGQTDSQLWYEGKHYMGNYSSTTLNELYVEDDTLIQRWRLDHVETGSKRVHSLAGGDGYVFAGTITDKMYVGGSIVVYDTRTGRWFYDREATQNFVIPKVVYHDKLVYAATSIYGGYAVNKIDTSKMSAKILVYDYEKRETIATLDPRDYISGLNNQMMLIGGLAVDPVVDGRFWAVVSETMFCFTFDKETLKFNVQEVISFDKVKSYTGGGRSMNGRNILLDPKTNSVYYSFDSVGGFQCIKLQDWNAPVGQVKAVSNGRIIGTNTLHYLLSEDGDLYYGDGHNLMMLPRNITQEDWEIAAKVDEMISKISNEITLETEATIKEVRSAYDNLSLRYKALIQNIDILNEAETDLLECKIDTIVVDNVTADDLPQLQEMMDTYNGMTSRNKRYVKNYEVLSSAYTKSSKLNDERLAAALQERINGLKDKFPLTLEHEPEVLDIRATYDAMTSKQRVLVDTAILEEAERQIAELRKEFVKYVESLIQAIPAEITLEAEPAITAAREAADKLYMTERKDVSYSKLTSAEGKLRTLKKAKAAAEEVDALIGEIGIVTLGDKERIAAAREAYDMLNDTALQFVTKAGKLKAAEFILKALQTWGIPAIVVADLGIVFAIFWFVPSLHAKVFKTKKKEEVTESEG